jgi:hypothetical protein
LKIQNYNFGKFRNLAGLLNAQMPNENVHRVLGEDKVQYKREFYENIYYVGSWINEPQ